MLYKPHIVSKWGLQSNFEFDKKIEILVDAFEYNVVPDNTIRIIIIQESYNTQWLIEAVNTNKDFYNYVFTYNQQILDSNEKAILFLCINTWIRNYNFPLKKFSVSTVVGGKNEARLEGHGLRQILWNRQSEINILKAFYLSSQCIYQGGNYKKNLVLGNDKSIMFNNEYHIAIENTSMKNMFTEKLIDCFQTKTIPIYYGALNIGDYFNTDGMYLVKNVDEIISVCNNLTPETYNTKINEIEDNYKRSMNYLSHTEILDRKLNEVLNK